MIATVDHETPSGVSVESRTNSRASDPSCGGKEPAGLLRLVYRGFPRLTSNAKGQKCSAPLHGRAKTADQNQSRPGALRSEPSSRSRNRSSKNKSAIGTLHRVRDLPDQRPGNSYLRWDFPRLRRVRRFWYESGECPGRDDRQLRKQARASAVADVRQRMVRRAGPTGAWTRARSLDGVCAARARRRSGLVDRRCDCDQSCSERRSTAVAPGNSVSRGRGAAPTPAAHRIVRTGHRRQESLLIGP